MKNRIYFIGLILSILFLLNGCDDDEVKSFVVINKYSVIGLDEVNASAVLVYRTRFEEGVTYTWTAPPGSTILDAGDGTDGYRVKVAFGSEDGDITVSSGDKSGSLEVTVNAVKPTAMIIIDDTLDYNLKEGNTDTVKLVFDIPLKENPMVELIAGKGASGSKISAVMKKDDKNYYIIDTAGTGNGRDSIKVTFISAAAYGEAKDTVKAHPIYYVDNLPPIATVSYSALYAKDTTIVTFTANFNEPMSTRKSDSVIIEVTGSGINAIKDSMRVSDDDAKVWVHTDTIFGTGNGPITVKLSRAKDVAQNDLASTQDTKLLTLDNEKPTLSDTLATDEGGYAKIVAKSNEVGTLYILILEDGEDAPKKASEVVANASSKSKEVNQVGQMSEFIERLDKGKYDIYFVSEDRTGNLSDIGTQVDFEMD